MRFSTGVERSLHILHSWIVFCHGAIGYPTRSHGWKRLRRGRGERLPKSVQGHGAIFSKYADTNDDVLLYAKVASPFENRYSREPCTPAALTPLPFCVRRPLVGANTFRHRSSFLWLAHSVQKEGTGNPAIMVNLHREICSVRAWISHCENAAEALACASPVAPAGTPG